MFHEEIKIYLQTERMYLRELTTRDEQIILKLDSDPEVMRYLTDGQPSSLEEVRENLLKTECLLKKHRGQFGFWAAYEKQSDKFLGWFHFRPCKKDPENIKRIELGYRFLKSFWGNGYATEGSTALIKKGFGELGVEEVFAITMKKNLSSQRVMEKVGLKFVREFVNSDFSESNEKDVEYSISKKTWLSCDRSNPF